MKGKIFHFLTGLFCCALLNVSAQDQKLADSLSEIYKQGNIEDTVKMELLRQLSFNEVRNLKLSLRYADELIRLARQKGNDKYIFHGYFQKGNKERILGDWKEALKAYFISAEIATKTKVISREGSAYGAIADVYASSDNFQNAMPYYYKAIAALRQTKDSISLGSNLLNAGEALRKNLNYDSALLYYKESEKIFTAKNSLIGKAYSLGNYGLVYASTGRNDLAEKNINAAIIILQDGEVYYPICDYLLSMSTIYMDKGDEKTALSYATRSMEIALHNDLKEQMRDTNLKLSEIFEKEGNPEQALKYFKNYISDRDKLNNLKSVQEMADSRTNYEVSQKQAEVNLVSRQKKLQRTLLFVSLAVLVVIIALVIKLLNNSRQKQKAYTLLRKEKEITEQQRDQTNKALQELKATQSQLIHRERMASLGELTAGIAHEIQNPLNFVNNFSEVNKELLLEMKDEIDKGNINEVKSIANNLIDNQEKINHHGKRADSIVKGMMQHARTGGGQKELTDINALANEYLKLSYHAIRAKDKSFNVTMVTHFDESIQKINITPQDVGRLLLNIYNNAFYSLAEKSREQKQGYEPAVTVTTKKLNKNVEVRIRDNGVGIPQKILNKIFEPFFTTKPSGAGTGLGLSLSYDIIKAHGGTVEIETKEGEFAEFIIQLPISV